MRILTTDTVALCQVEEYSKQAFKMHGNERGCIGLDGFMQMVATSPWSALLEEERVTALAICSANRTVVSAMGPVIDACCQAQRLLNSRPEAAQIRCYAEQQPPARPATRMPANFFRRVSRGP